MSDPRTELFAQCYADRVFAHQFIFERRHAHATPDFHPEMIGDFHSPAKYGQDIVFRGGAKSTVAEEAIALRAGFREFRYAVIVADTIDRAIQRLHAVRHEIENNDRYQAVFGDLRGPIWSADQIELSTGIMIQALGKGQSMRGMKYLDFRPDFFFADDLEDYPDVKTEKLRDATYRWFTATFLPACEPDHRGRMAANLLDQDCLAMRLKTYNDWPTRIIPIMHPDLKDPDKMVSSWPARFPVTRADAIAIGSNPESSIEAVMEGHQRSGTLAWFNREYMCRAEQDGAQTFRRETFKVEPRVKTWQPAFAMFDPARTVSLSASLTGFACWSWIAHKLVIWDAWAKPLMPDEIIRAIFELYGVTPNGEEARYCQPLKPIITGVEEDGLNEFLMQPIRQEQARQHMMIPVRAMRAPRGKLDFIKALQVYFAAREVEFAKPLPDLEGALLSFPAGKLDAPNALAYAPLMRGGAPIYHDFGAQHVGSGMQPAPNRRVYLALNATPSLLTAALVQLLDGALRIYTDWIIEGDPAASFADIIAEARLIGRRSVIDLVAPPQHFDRYSSVGLTQAAGRLNLSIDRGPDPQRGRRIVRDKLQREIRGFPALMVSDEAMWTINALCGGYRMLLTKQGMLADVAEEGPYRTLAEGIESFCAMAEANLEEDEDQSINWAVTPTGRRYKSMIVGRR